MFAKRREVYIRRRGTCNLLTLPLDSLRDLSISLPSLILSILAQQEMSPPKSDSGKGGGSASGPQNKGPPTPASPSNPPPPQDLPHRSKAVTPTIPKNFQTKPVASYASVASGKPLRSSVQVANPAAPLIRVPASSSAVHTAQPRPTAPVPSTVGLAANPDSGESSSSASSTQLTPEKQRKIRWDQAATTLPHRQRAPTRKDAEDVQVNYFKFTLDDSVSLYQYIIIFGSLGDAEGAGSKPSNTSDEDRKLSRSTRRFLAKELITANERVQNWTSNWACDYKSIIISAGPLFRGFDTKGYEQSTPQTRTDRGGTTIDVDSKLVYTSRLETSKLNAYVRGENDDKN